MIWNDRITFSLAWAFLAMTALVSAEEPQTTPERPADVLETAKLLDVLRNEIETKALSLPQMLPAEAKEYLPVGAKGTSREECLVLHCDTIFSELRARGCVLEVLMESLETSWYAGDEEMRRIDGHVYWLYSVFPKKVERESLEALSKEDLDKMTVTIWIDSTSCDQKYTIEERDAALRRAAELNSKVIEIYGSITDHASAEQAVEQLRPIVDEYEKQMHIVIMGTPDGEEWDMGAMKPKYTGAEYSAIMDKLLKNNFWDSSSLFELHIQFISCFVSKEEMTY